MHAAVAIGVPVRPHGHVTWQKSDRVSACLLFCLHHDLLHSAYRVLTVYDVCVYGEAVGGCGMLHPLTVFEGHWPAGFQRNELRLFSAEKPRAGHCGTCDLAQALAWAQIPIKLYFQTVRMGTGLIEAMQHQRRRACGGPRLKRQLPN